VSFSVLTIAALKVPEGTSVDVLLTDINMPDMNGEELVARLASEPSRAGLPLLVISTDRSEKKMRKMILLGVCGYVTKLLVPETLGAALTQIVGEAHHADHVF